MPCSTTGANGNLEATANGTNVTYMGDPGTDYYYEVDATGAIHTGGTAFSSASGKVYNFGQQPFSSQFDNSEIRSSTLTALNTTNTGFERRSKVLTRLSMEEQTLDCDARHPNYRCRFLYGMGC